MEGLIAQDVGEGPAALLGQGEGLGGDLGARIGRARITASLVAQRLVERREVHWWQDGDDTVAQGLIDVGLVHQALATDHLKIKTEFGRIAQDDRDIRSVPGDHETCDAGALEAPGETELLFLGRAVIVHQGGLKASVAEEPADRVGQGAIGDGSVLDEAEGLVRPP